MNESLTQFGCHAKHFLLSIFEHFLNHCFLLKYNKFYRTVKNLVTLENMPVVQKFSQFSLLKRNYFRIILKYLIIIVLLLNAN